MTLKIYPVVLELVRKLAPVLPRVRARSASLGDQMERALISIPLNVAEGAYSRGKNRHARYQSAAARWSPSPDAVLTPLGQRIVLYLARYNDIVRGKL
jgi:hypothetical protein